MYRVTCAASTCPIDRIFYTDDVLTVEKAIFHAMWARDYHLKSYCLLKNKVKYCFTNPKNELLYIYRFHEEP